MTTEVKIFRGRDNTAKFSARYADGTAVDLTGVSRVVLLLNGVKFDSTTLTTEITWTSDTITFKLGNTTELGSLADGYYAEGRVVLYDSLNDDGLESLTRLNVRIVDDPLYVAP